MASAIIPGVLAALGGPEGILKGFGRGAGRFFEGIARGEDFGKTLAAGISEGIDEERDIPTEFELKNKSRNAADRRKKPRITDKSPFSKRLIDKQKKLSEMRKKRIKEKEKKDIEKIDKEIKKMEKEEKEDLKKSKSDLMKSKRNIEKLNKEELFKEINLIEDKLNRLKTKEKLNKQKDKQRDILNKKRKYKSVI